MAIIELDKSFACLLALSLTYLLGWLPIRIANWNWNRKKAENSTKCKYKLLVALLSRANTHSALAHTHTATATDTGTGTGTETDTNTKNQIQFVLQYHCYRIHVWCIAFNVLFTQLTAEWTTDLKRNIIKNRAECAYSQYIRRTKVSIQWTFNRMYNVHVQYCRE